MPHGAFVTGVNLPWLHYGGDFGANAWRPEGGVGQPDRRVELDEALARLADRGLPVVRWFVLADGRAGITQDERGRPAALDACVRRDMDAALASLERHRLRAVFVMLDFILAQPAKVVGGVQTRGRGRWLRTADASERLVERALAPLAAHTAGSGAVLAWDVINEPEWLTWGWGGWDPFHTVRRARLRAFLAHATDVVRQAGRAPVTIGLASTRGLPLVRDLGLDVFQVHWYDHVDPPSALVTPASDFGLNAPLWLGEFPTQRSSQAPFNVLAAVEHAGYAGALAWSYLADDAFSSQTVCEQDVARYAARARAAQGPMTDADWGLERSQSASAESTAVRRARGAKAERSTGRR